MIGASGRVYMAGEAGTLNDALAHVTEALDALPGRAD